MESLTPLWPLIDGVNIATTAATLVDKPASTPRRVWA